MSKITNILPYSNFELIRSKIASILAIELANQKVLNQTALTLEQAKPTPDSSLISFYQLNISCIPSKVYEERFFRPLPEEMPLVNVVLTNVPLNDATSHTRQDGVNKYQIEVYQSSKSKSDADGDVLATLKLHRLLALIRMILMDRNYVDLELSGKVGYRQAQDLIIGQPRQGADNAHSEIFGKIDLLVKSTEEITDLDGVPVELTYNNMRIFDSEKGYYWQVGE